MQLQYNFHIFEQTSLNRNAQYKYKTMNYISILIFTALVMYIIIRYGVQRSISHSYYIKRNTAAFSVALCLFSFFAVLHNPHYLIIIAASGIVLVAAFADYRATKLYEVIHYAGAVIGIGSGMAYVALFISPIFLISFALMSILLIIFVRRTFIFWIELIAFYIIILCA